MARQITLRAVTPDRTVKERQADFVVLRTVGGDMGILPGHEPCCVLLDNGLLRIYEGKQQTDALVVLRGMATVRGDTVTVLSPIAEHPDKIQELLADMERQRLEKQQQEERSALEIHRAETALRRMLVSNDISAHAVMRGIEEEEEQRRGQGE